MQKSSQDPVDPFSLFPHRCENPGILGFLLTQKKKEALKSHHLGKPIYLGKLL